MRRINLTLCPDGSCNTGICVRHRRHTPTLDAWQLPFSPGACREVSIHVRLWVASLFAVILAVISMSPAIYAQALGESVEVNVPFAFEDGYQYFPPGLYTIRMESHNT